MTRTASTSAALRRHFAFDGGTGEYVFTKEGRPATAFLFNLISLLQFMAAFITTAFEHKRRQSPIGASRTRGYDHALTRALPTRGNIKIISFMIGG
jgi:hypothetical protein